MFVGIAEATLAHFLRRRKKAEEKREMLGKAERPAQKKG